MSDQKLNDLTEWLDRQYRNTDLVMDIRVEAAQALAVAVQAQAFNSASEQLKRIADEYAETSYAI